MEQSEARQLFTRLKFTRPFAPFEVETANGQRIKVGRAFAFAIGPKRVLLHDHSEHLHLVRYDDVKTVWCA